jgi:ABC-type sulfate/molybdate transport systems ATPase subunit
MLHKVADLCRHQFNWMIDTFRQTCGNDLLSHVTQIAQMSSGDMEIVFSLKKALRKSTTTVLKQLGQAHIQRQCKQPRRIILQNERTDCPNGRLCQSAQDVKEQVHKHEILKNARAVSCYISMEYGELSTDGLIRDILAASKLDR